MSGQRVNPFNELYVTETIPPEHFVSLFSPFLVQDTQDALVLFQPGNVILKGIQGSGKSMLLNLLKPEIRIAYKKAGKPLPLPEELTRFIGAGINFTRSVAIDFGQRPIETTRSADSETMPIYFGDFVNYWIVEDMLNSVEKLQKDCAGQIADELNISRDRHLLDAFAVELASDSCWFGYLDGVSRYDALRDRISARIKTYRAFLNYNIDVLPSEIASTKTTVGEPISKAAAALWVSGVVPRSTPFLIRIDQYEELLRLELWSKALAVGYRRIVNKVLGMRDPRISYRIGTRRYAWGRDLQIYGTTSGLELERDYKLVDIDEILRRRENSKTWIFPGFAEDVFARRLQHAGYRNYGKSLRSVFGDGLSPEEKAARYAKTSRSNLVAGDLQWPRSWTDLLIKIAETNPLSAKLGEAWARQSSGRRLALGPPDPPLPWEKGRSWRKERLQQALMQIAHQWRQRMLWAGTDEVLLLSGGNILVFMNVAQQIWAAWLRSTRASADDARTNEDMRLPNIDPLVQAVGVQMASTIWHNKIRERTGGSHQRKRFIDLLGRLFREKLVGDRAMSYPGHNGFSLSSEDLRPDIELSEFLETAVDYGDLFDAPHTTKMKDRRPRTKYYLNPILSPHFQIPASHVKEPMYVSVETVHGWWKQADQLSGGLPSGEASPVGDPDELGGQLSLFGWGEPEG